MKLILEESGRQITYDIPAGEPAVIGRGLENAIPIRDTDASRRHCQVEVGADGGARAKDLGSKNGTRLNGASLAAETVLKPGDCLEIGAIKIWFEERPEAAGTPTPEPPARIAAAALSDSSEEAPTPAPAAPAGRFSLETIEGEHAGKRFPIERFPFKIGRTKKNAIIVHDTGVSGEHCEIVARGDGCALVDLGSTNGTKVNGAKVKRAILTAGAKVVVGASTFVFHDAEKPASAAPAKPAPVVAKPAPAAAKPAPAAAAKPKRPSGSGRAPVAAPAAAAASDVVAASVAPAPAAHAAPAPAAPAPESALDEAARALGQSVTAAAVEDAPAARGALAVALAAVAVLVAAGLFAVSFLRRAADAAVDSDPSPRGNRVANWSFEEEADLDRPPPRWKAASGTIAVDARAPAGGLRSARVAPRAAEIAEVRSVSEIAAGVRDVHVRGMIRGGPAALGVLWESSADPAFRLLSTTDLADAGSSWTDVRAALRPPLGADRARLVLLAAGEAWFDRISMAEREASTARALGTRVEAAGLVARLDERGLLEIVRDEWPVFDRGGLVLLGPGRFAPLARQDAAAEAAAVPPPKEEKKKKADPAAPPAPPRPRVAGAIVRPDGGRARFAEVVESRGAALEVRFRVEEAGADVAPAIALYVEHAARAGRFELTAAETRKISRPDAPFDEPGVGEVAFGAGNDAVSLRLDPPLRVRVESLGRGLVLTLAAAPGAREVGFRFGRGSTREGDMARSLFEEAQAEKKAGRLEEARRLFARIGRDAAHDPEIRDRARQAEAALAARAESALAEAAAIEGDIAAFGAGVLLESAEARCRFVIDAYPGTPYAGRAQEGLLRVGDARRKLAGKDRAVRARELLDAGRKHLDGRRYRLARLYLRAVVEGYPELEDLAGDARRDAELAERQMKDG